MLSDYTVIWNLLHYPAGSLPVTEVTQDEALTAHQISLGHEYRYEDGYDDDWTRVIRDDIQGSEGMPVSVQVVAMSH